jgi:hypothetical protein
MKRKILFLLFAFGGVLALAALFQWTNKGSKEIASLNDALNTAASSASIYSFYKDDDLDGLSNAEEVIYGSSVIISDTDGDNYLDGEEVMNGYDPIKAGSAKLRERTNLSLTIQYFLWAKEAKKITNPKIEDNLVKEFANQNPALITITTIDDKDIILISQNDQVSVRNYLSELNKIGLPEGIASYKDIADSFNQNSVQLLNDLLAKIELAKIDFKNLQTPPDAKEIQKGYLTIIKEFSDIFSDLRFYQEDPITIELNLIKAEKLIDLSQKIDDLKL